MSLYLRRTFKQTKEKAKAGHVSLLLLCGRTPHRPDCADSRSPVLSSCVAGMREPQLTPMKLGTHSTTVHALVDSDGYPSSTRIQNLSVKPHAESRWVWFLVGGLRFSPVTLCWQLWLSWALFALSYLSIALITILLTAELLNNSWAAKRVVLPWQPATMTYHHCILNWVFYTVILISCFFFYFVMSENNIKRSWCT